MSPYLRIIDRLLSRGYFDDLPDEIIDFFSDYDFKCELELFLNEEKQSLIEELAREVDRAKLMEDINNDLKSRINDEVITFMNKNYAGKQPPAITAIAKNRNVTPPKNINYQSQSKNNVVEKTVNYRASRLNPKTPDFLSVLGELKIHKSEIKEAEKILSELLKKSPHHILALNDFASLKMYQNKWKEALNLLQRVINLDNTCEDAFANLRFIESEKPGTSDVLKSRLYITIVPTFPRSGHHLLQACLTRYFLENFHYCEFYSCCNTVLCRKPLTNFQKNHDLQLTLVNDLANNYIVQYRHPIDSIISFFNLSVKKYGHKDSQETFINFFRQKIEFWKKFVNKWIINNDNPYTYYLSYHDMVNSPHDKLKEIIEFLNPTDKVNMNRISEIVAERDINVKNKKEDFKYYDPVFLKEMESKVYDELNYIKLERYF